MRTYKPKQKKAIWYRSQHPESGPKRVMRIRPVSKRRSKLLREYAKKAAAWKENRMCAGYRLRDAMGRLVCSDRPHKCTDVHHYRGRLGKLLLDDLFWIPVCRRLHNWIGQNPEQARKNELLCDIGEWNRPE